MQVPPSEHGRRRRAGPSDLPAASQQPVTGSTLARSAVLAGAATLVLGSMTIYIVTHADLVEAVAGLLILGTATVMISTSAWWHVWGLWRQRATRSR